MKLSKKLKWDLCKKKYQEGIDSGKKPSICLNWDDTTWVWDSAEGSQNERGCHKIHRLSLEFKKHRYAKEKIIVINAIL